MGKRFWHDPELRGELHYCVPLGIPHSVFRGWDPDDRAKALAYEREIETICPSCGTRRDDWIEDVTLEDGTVTWQPIHPPKFDASTLHCEGCRTVGQARKNLPDDAHDKGVTVRLVPAKPHPAGARVRPLAG